jgi:hypothetical protein
MDTGAFEKAEEAFKTLRTLSDKDYIIRGMPLTLLMLGKIQESKSNLFKMER